MLKHSILTAVFLLSFCMGICQQDSNSWCSHPMRSQFRALREMPTRHPWFRVYRVGNGIFAITEPDNYQEVISYLITGKDSALLFDTGMGLDTISAVVKELTNLPVIVLNSHTHYDHIGGNAEFNNILAMNTAFTRHNAANGWPHSVVKGEVQPASICLDKLPGADTATYAIRPFTITRYISDGDKINLGGRTLEVVAAPGHTPDAIALLDRGTRSLFTGDTFYEGAVWLFSPETDLKAYEQSINKLAALAPTLFVAYPAHNTPIAKPQMLDSAKLAFALIRQGKVAGKETDIDNGNGPQKAMLFNFNGFGYLIRKDLLERK